MITPLFTMAGSLLTMAFPILMLLSGKHTAFVPWLILVSNLLLGLALFSTFSQRRVLVLHRGVHLSVVLFVASVVCVFVDQISHWIALGFCFGLFFTTYRVAEKTSAGFGVQFRREWDSKTYLQLNPSRLNAMTLTGNTWPRRRNAVGIGNAWFCIAGGPSTIATRRKSGASLRIERRYRLLAAPLLNKS